MSDGLHLFLVEDDDAFAVLVTNALQQSGHRLTRCRTGMDALIVLAHHQFDLVLIEQHLPDSTGMDLFVTLKREGISAPAILITPDGEEGLVRKALQSGIVDHWIKDVSPQFMQELPRRVAEAISRQHLAQMNHLLLAALEATQDGILITDVQGRILHVNRALERMTGYLRGELLGKNPRIFKNEATSPEVFVDIWRTILARSSWQGELSNRRKDGTLLDISLTISPVVDEHGQLKSFISIQRDIKQRKFAESQSLQLQKTQAVGTLAGGIAHEFNNLLTGINGYATLGLQETALLPGVLEYFQRILDLADRAATLTRQLLTYARKPQLACKPTRIREIIQKTADVVASSLQMEVDLELPTPSAESPELYVDADAKHLQQALVNLAINARDAQVGVGSIILRLRSIQLKSPLQAFPENVPAGEFVLMEVIDKGKGMTPEVFHKALDPFFTTKAVGQGTGMGLPMVLGIVRAHHGYVTIETQVGRGTTVGIYLPRLLEAPKKRRKKLSFQPGQIIEPETSPGRHIVLVDDEDSVRDVLKRFLETAGQHVHCAANTLEALAQIKGNAQADLLILDPIAPPETTVLILECWRQGFPKGPVLFCTGQTVLEAHRKLLEAGPYWLIQKPFRMNELWYSVQLALGAAVGLK